MPRSRNTRIRAKNTSRTEARRRYKDEQRELETEAEAESPEDIEEAAAEEPQKRTSALQMPDVLDDLRHLPEIFFSRKKVWLPFGLLALTFVLALALINGALDELPPMVRDGITLYISLTLHPTSLFIFFIGGFLAPRGSYIVGGVLGVLSAVVYLAVISIATDAARESMEALTATSGGEVPEVASELTIQTLVIGLLLGLVVGGFAGWVASSIRRWRGRTGGG